MNIAFIVIILIVIAFALFYISQNKIVGASADLQTAKKDIEEGRGMVIDVRTEEEYTGGHLKKAKYNWDVTSGEFEENLESLDKDQTYYLYCRSGNRSGKATELMKQHGFKKVYNIGGYQDLVNAGLESSI